ncbi:hypothetical protein GIB67_021933 [Kingdonia uniflora]|uniref:RNase H type-1 domain-containing protein n=1 Tax=Kingdonia uniflora TaxID=39325 RepID=A0A7J7N4Q1_9MAGN|nr:hypothetical protein GIB67_021933 [Kingdonia uniflora]
MSWSSRERFRLQEKRWPRRRDFLLLIPEMFYPCRTPGPHLFRLKPQLAGTSSTPTPLGCGSTRAADPEEAEAVAVVRGMEAALRIGLHRVLILTDCQRLVSAFKDRPEDLSWGALTWALDIRALATRFEDFRFEFVHRSCNYDAHFLAAWGACTPDFAFLEDPQASAFVDSVRPDQ